jgi:hypothetical protein
MTPVSIRLSMPALLVSTRIGVILWEYSDRWFRDIVVNERNCDEFEANTIESVFQADSIKINLQS